MPNELFTNGLATSELELDSDGGIDWDEVEVVTIDDPPHTDAFGTDQFYEIPTTVTREMAQPYEKGGRIVTLKKPAEELKQSSWSLDNRPITLGHPEPKGTPVRTMDEIHGFVRDPRFDADGAIQRATTYIPVNDDVALDAIEDGMTDVSPGFRNDYATADEDNIDAYQTDIVYDHLALVKQGRCSREQGCGLTADNSHQNGCAASEGCGLTADSPHGHVTEMSDTDSTDIPMTDGCSCDGDGSTDPLIEVDALSLDAIATKHDGVQEVIDERDELATDIDDLQETVDEKEEQLAAAKTTVDELKEELSEYRESEKEVVVDSIMDLTSVWDEDDLMDLEVDTLEERLTLAKDMAADVKDVDVTGDSEDTDDDTTPSDDEYATGGSLDLSHTA